MRAQTVAPFPMMIGEAVYMGAPVDLVAAFSGAITNSKVLRSPAETLAAAREGILMAYGVLPSLLNRSATGPVVREAQRQLAIWTLQPIAALLADEASAKLGGPVEIDTIRPLQAFDAGGRARALSAIIKTMAEAKEAGIPPGDVSGAMRMVDWER